MQCGPEPVSTLTMANAWLAVKLLGVQGAATFLGSALADRARAKGTLGAALAGLGAAVLGALLVVGALGYALLLGLGC
jgi:hypothetical protein